MWKDLFDRPSYKSVAIPGSGSNRYKAISAANLYVERVVSSQYDSEEDLPNYHPDRGAEFWPGNKNRVKIYNHQYHEWAERLIVRASIEVESRDVSDEWPIIRRMLNPVMPDELKPETEQDTLDNYRESETEEA